MRNFVTSDWLVDNMDRNDLVICDVRYVLGDEEYGEREYSKGHIEGAVFIPMEELLTGVVEEHGGRHPLPDLDIFAENMRKLGIDDNKTVVAYDDGELAMAGRLWWMLRYIGMEKVYILKGGIKQWKDEKRALTGVKKSPEIGGKLTVDIRNDMIANVADVKDAVGKTDAVIVDSRTPDRYKGEVEPIDRIPGHIPSAVNYPWDLVVETFYQDQNFDLKSYYKEIENFDKIIVHCGSGITGTVNVMFMEEAGLDPILYLGGYSDWISYNENEVIREV